MEYIIIIGAFQALLALCLFVANRQRKPADNLLTWITIAEEVYDVKTILSLGNAYENIVSYALLFLLFSISYCQNIAVRAATFIPKTIIA